MTKKQPSAWKDAGDAGTVGIELVLSVLLLGWLGFWADGQLGTSPILTIVGGVLGMAAGLWTAYKAIVKEPKE